MLDNKKQMPYAKQEWNWKSLPSISYQSIMLEKEKKEKKRRERGRENKFHMAFDKRKLCFTIAMAAFHYISI